MIKIDVAQLIMDETKKLMKTRSIDKISVKEICMACDISRQTFYKYFPDKYDIPITIYYRMIINVLDNFDNSQPWYYSIAHMMELMKEDKDFYINALKYSGQNSIADSMHQNIYNGYIYEIKRRPELILDEEMDYVLHYNAYAATGCCLAWMRSGMKEDPFIIAKKIVDCMPEKMRIFLEIE